MSDAGRDGTLTNENASELLREAINDGFNAAVRSPKEHPWSDVDFIAEVLLQSQWLAGVIADATIDETADAEKWNNLYVRAEERARAAEPPCDGGCNYNSGPEETCSAHGRTVVEVWEIAERATAKLAAVQQLLDDANDAATSRPYDLVDNLWRNALTRALAGTEQEGNNHE